MPFYHNVFKEFLIKNIMEEEKREENAEKIIEEMEKKHEEKSNSEEDNSNKKNLTEKIRENPWVVSTLVLGILSFLLIAGNFSGGISGEVISAEEAGLKIIDFANSQVGGEVELVSTELFGDNLYQVTILFQNQEVPLYITRDGKNLIQGVMPFDALMEEREETQSNPSQEIVKSDKPVVELFIMTHCPYGTQAEKGMIPVFELLGDKIEGKIRFVHYFMHQPEERETPIQVCIREEQPEKYLAYLKCFLQGDGNADASGYIANNKDSATCRQKVGINEEKLTTCLEESAEVYYDYDSELSQSYGVQGSPTLIINGVKISSGRDSASYLKVVCDAFNEAPEECSAELSSASPSPGFGYDTTNSETTAQC